MTEEKLQNMVLFNPDDEFLRLIKEGATEYDAQTIVLKLINESCNILRDSIYTIMLGNWKIRTKKQAEQNKEKNADQN